MKYLIFSDSASALARSASEAASRGAGDGKGDETKYWWSVQNHPTDGRAALSVPAEDQAVLTSDEQAALLDALSDDWRILR